MDTLVLERQCGKASQQTADALLGHAPDLALLLRSIAVRLMHDACIMGGAMAHLVGRCGQDVPIKVGH